MQPIVRPLPADPARKTMAEREKEHFLTLDAENRRDLRRQKVKALRRFLPF